MRKIYVGAWVGIVASILGFLIAMSAVVSFVGPGNTPIVLGFMLLFATIFFLIYKWVVAPTLNALRLSKTGIHGTGRILEIRDTGVKINNQSQVKLLLAVKSEFGQRYEAMVRTLVPRQNTQVYQVGMYVDLRIDPYNEKNLVILPFPAEQNQPQTSPSVQPDSNAEETLPGEHEHLKNSNESILQSGRAARAIVKNLRRLGVDSNGNHPIVELELEVQPEHAASFDALARGVIAESALARYQPGSVIRVKYDYYDNSKVVIDRSTTS